MGDGCNGRRRGFNLVMLTLPQHDARVLELGFRYTHTSKPIAMMYIMLTTLAVL
jgi:hypothetical protein